MRLSRIPARRDGQTAAGEGLVRCRVYRIVAPRNPHLRRLLSTKRRKDGSGYVDCLVVANWHGLSNEESRFGGSGQTGYAMSVTVSRADRADAAELMRPDKRLNLWAFHPNLVGRVELSGRFGSIRAQSGADRPRAYGAKGSLG